MNLHRLLSLTFLCLLSRHNVHGKEDFLPTAATTTATATALASSSAENSKEEDSVKSGDASHDEAYNAIITNYYTTDPFFGVKSDNNKKERPQSQPRPPPSSRNVGERRMSPDPMDGSKRKKVKVLLRKMIPAPLLSHISAEDDDDDVKFSTTPMSVPAKKSHILQSKIPAPLLVGGAQNEDTDDKFGIVEVFGKNNQESEDHSRFKRMHLRTPPTTTENVQTTTAPAAVARPERGVFSQLLPQEKKPQQDLKKSEEQKKEEKRDEQKEKEAEQKETSGFFGQEMKKVKDSEDGFFGGEKFNFQEDVENDDFFGSVDNDNVPNFFDDRGKPEEVKKDKKNNKERGFYDERKREKESFNFKEDENDDGFFGTVDKENVPKFFDNVDNGKDKKRGGQQKPLKESFNFKEDENDEGFFGKIETENLPNFFENGQESKRGYFDGRTFDGRTRTDESFNFEENENEDGFFGKVNTGDEKRRRGPVRPESNGGQDVSLMKRGPGFLDGEREKFNFSEDESEPFFPGDQRKDIPTLPRIETTGKNEPDTTVPGRKSQTYFDIMSDFFDEPEINIFPDKNVAPRSVNYAAPPRPHLPVQPHPEPGFYGEPKAQKLRQIRPTTQVGHTYAQPLKYLNPLDVDHNAADVGFYRGPKVGGGQRPHGFAPPQPPRPFQPPHQPRLLEEAVPDAEFLDIPKIGVAQNEFFGEALTRQNSFDDSFGFDESSRPSNGFDNGDDAPPPNFPRPNIASQLDDVPEQRQPSFVGGFTESDFEEPEFDVRQNFQDLRPEFRDIDDGSFNKVEPFPQTEEFDGGRQKFPGPRALPRPDVENEGRLHEARHLRPVPETLRLEEVPMPHLDPPPEMLEMQRNSLFPVDVPKLGANLPYRPPELIFDEFHNQRNPPSQFPREEEINFNQLPTRNLAKKEATNDQFYAPIRAQIKEFKEENISDDRELQFFEPTPPSPQQVKKARSIFRSTPASQIDEDGEFHPTPSAHFERARQEFESQQYEGEFQPTPSTALKQSGLFSTPPFEPVRANVQPFEPDNSKYITPTEATLFEPKDDRFARQVKPEHYDYTERPVSKPEPYKHKPANRPEFLNLRPVNPPEPVSHRPVNRPEAYNPRPVNQPEQRPTTRPETRPETYNPRPASPQEQRSVNRPQSLTNNHQENEIESFSSAFLATPREIEKLHPSREDLSTGRPDPFEFHQKIAAEFDGSRTKDDDDEGDNEIVFSGSRSYQTDPFRVTDPPIFTDKHRESFEDAPMQSETYEPESRSNLMGRANQHTVEEPSSNYAIYDPMSFKPSNTRPSFRKLDENDYNEEFASFESGKFAEARSLDVDDDIYVDKENAERRSYKYPENDDNVERYSRQRSLGNVAMKGNYDENVDRSSFDYSRALQFSTTEEYDVADAHQFTHVEDRDRFQAGHSRGNPRHHVHDTQHHDGQKHREEVDFEALLAAASASVRGPLSTFDDWSQRIMSTNSVDSKTKSTNKDNDAK